MRALSNVTPLQTRDLHDLFTLGADIEGGTATGDLFADSISPPLAHLPRA